MAKAKFDFKDLLLRKGEYIALGVAGVGLVVLLLMGVSTGAGAANPDEISKKFTSKSENILRRISDPNDTATPDPLSEDVRAGKSAPYQPIGSEQFATNAILFDVVGRPDSKRENPRVQPIEDYQVDLLRGAMPGYDIINVDGRELIAVRVEKKLDKNAQDKIRDAIGKMMKKNSNRPVRSSPPPAAPPGPGAPPGAGGGAPPPGAPPGAGGPGGAPPPAAPPGAGGGLPPMGNFGFGGSGSFSGAEQRVDVAISYIPLDELDKAATENKLPAQTVIPLRMIVVNFTIPLKKQMEEVKKALRLANVDVARGIIQYDGFEVKRKITQQRPNGPPVVIQDWTKYNYEEKFVDLIYSRKLRDHVEGTDKSKQGQYLPYFYRYEDSLVMPLPELVSELGSYPPIRMQPILDTIDRLDRANTPKVDPSSTLNRLQKKGSRKEWFNASSGDATGASTIFGGADPKAPGGNPPAKGGTIDNQQQVDIDHLLGRFVDCDVQPGLTYEYQIQLKMLNPNFGAANVPFVSNPNDTKTPLLFSPWVPLPTPLTVPAEDFLFASDRNQYVADIQANYKDQPNLKKALDAKDNQAVVQVVKWMESIRMEGKHEPIGGWVVAEMPVSRGEYIGKKTFVKLPLWSSERNEYVFRELSAGAVKGKDQPKGWLVDFSSRSILLDYEGGKVTTRTASGRTLPTEEVATEMLIVRPDGKLVVRRSTDDQLDPTRKEHSSAWEAWLKRVESRPTTSAGQGDSNQFERPKQ